MSHDVETGVEAPVPNQASDAGDLPLVTVVTDLGDENAPLDQRLNAFIESHGVVVISKTFCPFCRDVIEFLGTQIGVHVDVIEVNKHPQGRQIQKIVKDKTNHPTVPAVFIKGQFVGGCDEVKALHAKGELEGRIRGLVAINQTMGSSKLETAKLIPVKRGDARNPPFWFPNVVNNYVVRITGLQVFALAVLSAVFYDEDWGQFLAVGLLVDFILRMLAGSSLSPLGMIATAVAAPFRPQFRPGPPKQFAALCGVMFSLLATIFYFVDFGGHDIVGAVIMAMLAGAAGLEAFLDFCLGCLFFSWAIQFGIFPDSVYRIYTTSKQEIEDTWDYANINSHAPVPERVDTDPGDEISLKYKKKTDEWTKDDFDIIRHMQVIYFAVPLSITGLAIPFKIASDWGDRLGGQRLDIVPDAWYQVFAVVGAAVLAIMLVLYAARLLLYPKKCIAEWHCPLRSNSFGGISICFILFAFLLYDEVADDPQGSGAQWVARVAFWMGAVTHAVLTIAKMGEWVGTRLELEHVHTYWMVMPVGLSVAALVAPSIPMFEVDGNTSIESTLAVSRFFYSFAYLMWVTLFVITFFKTITTHNSDDRLRHGVFAWIAAPSVIGLANLTICLASGFSTPGECEADFSQYYFIGLFIFLILCWATLPYIAFFGRDKFGSGYWTECFAFDTLASCAAAYYALNGYNASRTLMYISLTLAAVTNACAFLHTTVALIRRHGVFTPEPKWGPLSFMKLTHEAFRGNMGKLRATLDALDIKNESGQNEDNLGLFAARFNQFCILHEEHSKHEDKIIFKTINDFFHDHAKRWNDDHIEVHHQIEEWRDLINQVLDNSVDERDRQSALDMVKEELPPFFDRFLEHLKGEEDNLQPIARKYIPLELQKQISRECFRITPADRWEVIIPFIVNNLPRHDQRIRYLKVMTWSMPERAQQIGAIVYRNVDAVMWERLRAELPEIIPRAATGWRRYY